jgi:hypothetical protein
MLFLVRIGLHVPDVQKNVVNSFKYQIIKPIFNKMYSLVVLFNT